VKASFPQGTLTQVLHGCRQLVSWDVGLSPATSATLIPCCQRVMAGTLGKLPVQAGGRWGRRQVSMALTPWATHMLQWTVHRPTRKRELEAIGKIRSQFGLQAATRLHEAGIASNRRSAIRRWIRSRALYTPPVTLWELAMPEVVTLTARRGMPKAGLVTGVKS
jgi:hypothetical protein